MKSIIRALTFLLAVPCLALAQAPGTQDSLRTPVPEFEVDPLVVTATRQPRPVYRVPYAVNVLNQDAVQLGEAGISLEETLRSLPGIVVQNRYNLSQGDRIILRGVGTRSPFGVRGLKIIQDGIPLTFADGQSQLNNIDLTSTGQIEVLRGPSSALYGNASGGLISLQTQTLTTPFRFQPRFIVGSNGLRRWQGNISGQFGRHQYLVNVNSLWQDGYREFSFARSTNINAVGRHTLSENVALATVFNYYDAPYLFNPSSLDKPTASANPASARTFVQLQGASKEVKQGQGGVTLQYRDDASNRVDVTVYGVGRTLFNPIPGQIIDLDRTAGGVRTVFSRRKPLGNVSLHWTVGTDFEFQDDTRKEWANSGIPASEVGRVNDERVFDLLTFGPQQLNQDEQVFGFGPFVELELTPRPDWVFTLGGRYDRYKFEVTDNFLTDNIDDSGSRTMDAFSPMIGLTYRPHRILSLYGNYATAFQTPSTTELSNRLAGEGGFNPDLDPERLRNLEVGAKGLWGEQRFAWDVAFYMLNINDMLIPFQINDPNTEEVYFRNAGETRNIGMELRLDWAPVNGLQTALAYTLMNFEFQDFQVETDINNVPTLIQLEGNEVPGVPPQHLYAGVVYRHASGPYGEFNLQWFDDFFANDFNGPAPGGTKPVGDFVNDGYALADLRLGVQRAFAGVGVDLFLGVNNLFDKQYNGSVVVNSFGDRFFEPAAGRTWYLGIGVPVSGAGR